MELATEVRHPRDRAFFFLYTGPLPARGGFDADRNGCDGSFDPFEWSGPLEGVGADRGNIQGLDNLKKSGSPRDLRYPF